MVPPVSNSRAIPRIVACAFFMQMLDSSIIATSLPQMARSFGTIPTHLSIGITAYLLVSAALVPMSGWVADRFGARNVFALAVAVFTVASLGCGLSQSLFWFVMARVVQGAGAAMMGPVGRMVVLRHTEKSQMLDAISVITYPALVAPVIGPVIGGFITTYVSWRWNFWLNVPLGIVGIALVLTYIPNYLEQRRPLDWVGFLLSSVALTCLLYGLESIARGDGDWLLAILLLIAGLMIGATAIRHLWRSPHPLLELSSTRVETFSVSTMVPGTLYRTAIEATPFMLPLMFQVAFGLSSWASGLLILAYFAGNLLMKTVTTPILRQWGFRTVLTVNGLAGGIAMLSCGFLLPSMSNAAIMAVLFLAGAFRSMQYTSLNTLGFADISGAQRSAATTLSAMMQQIGSCLGIALAALLLTTSQKVFGDPAVGLQDFRWAFVVIGVLAVATSFRFAFLPADAGGEISARPSS